MRCSRETSLRPSAPPQGDATGRVDISAYRHEIGAAIDMDRFESSLKEVPDKAVPRLIRYLKSDQAHTKCCQWVELNV